MVSSKFARSKHAFRSPDVCKKKKEAEEECSFTPDDTIENWYEVDVFWFIWRYVFAGTILLEKEFATHWATPGPPPTDGEWATFDYSEATQLFSAHLRHMVGGVNVVSLNIYFEPLPPNCPFNTEQFNYTSALWQGPKAGRIYNL